MYDMSTNSMKSPLLLQSIYLIVILVLFGCGNSSSEKKNSKAPNRSFPVRAIILKPSIIQSNFSATGTFEPNEQVTVATEVAGRIDKIHFEEGEIVNKNQVLVSINADDIAAERRRLQTNLKNAKSKLKRGEKLRKIDAISEEEVEDLTFEVENIGNQLYENKIRLNKTKIRAPFTGMTGFRELSPGAYVNVGEPIVEIVQFDPLKIHFELPQEYAGQINKGDSVTVFYSEGKSYRVPIESISYRVKGPNRSFELRTTIENENREIPPGSFAKIEVAVYESDSALLIPSDALIKTIDQEEIFLAKNGKAVKTAVQSGNRTENSVELIGGVEAGDTVIITGLVSLSNGNQVSTSITDWQK